ncbi:MAG: sigma-70 family RNA polymerase sigma factor [Sandaracinaceae bacterium]|nr:sigma-70 family RNA polymerase sigma factor [Sandaracinaceae bacterium]
MTDHDEALEPPLDVAGALAAARDGDVSPLFAAADELRPYLKAVARAVLRGRLGGKVDASDVVQQGLLASMERFDQFRGETPEEWQRWLVAIVRNEARNLLRYWHQEKRQVAAEDAVMGSRAVKPESEGRASARLAGGGPSPSLHVAAREEAARMLSVLDRMPAEARQILVLRHFEGLSHAEIAERLDMSPDAARQAWVRALRSLRQRLSEAS